MKAIKKKLKSITIMLALVILIQGCTVYKTSGVSLDEAVKFEKKVQLITKSDYSHKFQRIGIENGEYYGIKKLNREMIKVNIAQNNVKKIRLHDKTLSTVLNVGIPLIIIIGILGAISSGVSKGFKIGPIPLTAR